MLASVLLVASEVLSYLPEGIFGLIIILLIYAVVTLWKNREKREEYFNERLDKKDELYKDALEQVLEGLKESNQVVSRITTAVADSNKPIYTEIIEHDKKMSAMLLEVKIIVEQLGKKE
jgi:ABC-type siderophore export system fused ATPase/permease subunit